MKAGTILILGGVAGLAFWVYTAAKRAITDFTFDIVGYGKPSLNGFMLSVPLSIRFKNPTPLKINVDNMLAEIYVRKGDSYVKAATINQPILIPSGESTQTITPSLDIKSIFGGNLLDTATAIASIVNGKKVFVRTDVTITYKGVTIPKQQIDPQEISFA